MDKFTYLIEAFNHRAYTKKAFLLSILSIINYGQEDKLKNIPYACHRDWDNDQCFFIRPETNEKIIIDGVVASKPLFVKNEPITISVTDSKYLKESVETTVGRYILNIVVLFEAFKGKVDYINEQVDGGRLKSIIRDLMIDNPEEGEDVPEGKASVDECLKVTQQMDYLEGLNPVLVKASSLDIFTIDPEIVKLRDELLKELEEKDLLEDPVAVAKVIDTLVAKDAEIQYNGPSKDLFIKKSFVTDSRKKMFIVFDMIEDFHSTKYNLLRNSLSEGWDVNKFPAYINTAINASYSRSVSVGAAGADVKVVMLLTNRIRVEGDDCKSPRTEPVSLSELNFKRWVGGYRVEDKNVLKIDTSDYDKLVGKTVGIRVPQYCQQPKGNLCKVCCGETLGADSNRVSTSVVRILTTFFLGSMKSIHVSSLKTKVLSLEQFVR